MLQSLDTQIGNKLKSTQNYDTIIYHKNSKTQNKVLKIVKTLSCKRKKSTTKISQNSKPLALKIIFFFAISWV